MTKLGLVPLLLTLSLLAAGCLAPRRGNVGSGASDAASASDGTSPSDGTSSSDGTGVSAGTDVSAEISAGDDTSAGEETTAGAETNAGDAVEVSDVADAAPGTEGMPCFPDDTCLPKLYCITVFEQCEPSAICSATEWPAPGDEGARCHPNGTCNGGLICDLGTCVEFYGIVTTPPGEDGALCYANGTCNDGFLCNGCGLCEPIPNGGLFGPCIEGHACNLGLSCRLGDSPDTSQCDFGDALDRENEIADDEFSFLFSNIPVVRDGALELPDGASDIVLSFTKQPHPLLSSVTLETEGGIPVGQVAVHESGQGRIRLEPTADLVPGLGYLVRYDVVAEDGVGAAHGSSTFTVPAAAAPIAFVSSNLRTEPIDCFQLRLWAPYWGERIITLDFSAAVDPAHPGNFIELVDDAGRRTAPSFEVSDRPDNNVADDEPGCGDRRRVRFFARLAPSTTYTLSFRMYAGPAVDEEPNDPATVYIQVDRLSFPTAGHITLSSTNVGDYSDRNDDGVFDPIDFTGASDFPASSTIAVGFTERIDLVELHPNQYVHLYRDGNENGIDYADDLVRTVSSVAGAIVTLTPEDPLDAAARYCVGYHVTSAHARADGTGGDVVADESEQAALCFRTAAAIR